jgi:S-(hydroxymethyl)glutathione dehydrogenase/alcohol dehydrogenase
MPGLDESLFARGKAGALHWLLDVRELHCSSENRLSKIRQDAPFHKVCCIGCGAPTGTGAVINTAKDKPRANVVLFGLGGIGLNVIQGARDGWRQDRWTTYQPDAQIVCTPFGITHFVNQMEGRATLYPI